MHIQDLWESSDLSAVFGRAALTPLSWLYGAGWQAYLKLYEVGLKKAAEPHFPVVCIGNLSTGGTGKTPMTMHLVQVMREMGKRVVVGCSGYGSPRAEAATIAPDGPLSPKEWGDEPALLRSVFPDLPLVVGRRRVLAAELVHLSFPDAVLLMDDGFQHLPLKKHIHILLDPESPKNSMCLPAGPYREPRRNRMRADLVLPGRFQIVEKPMKLVSAAGEESVPDDYTILCALGQPRRFIENVQEKFPQRHPNVVSLPDHDPLDEPNLFGSGIYVVTGKDWVKIRERDDINPENFLIATREVSVEPQAEFRMWLSEKLK